MRVRDFGISFLIFSIIIFLDRVAKFWVLDLRGIYRPFKFLNIQASFNKGISFGFLSQNGARLFIIFAILVLILALIYLIYRRFLVGVSFIGELFVLGGAVSNLFDRFYYGGVLDYIMFLYNGEIIFPAFNLADVAICIGAVIMLLRKE